MWLSSLLAIGALLSTGVVASTVPQPRPARRRATRREESAASSLGYSSIVVFGDSFSDNGNGSYRISNNTWPLVPPYYQGRFSNGPVWPEYLSDSLSIPLYDYATGGATTSNALVQGYTGPSSSIPVPSVADQIASFLSGTSPQNTSSVGEAGESPLLIIWAGANDIFFNPNISAAQSLLEISSLSSLLLSSFPSGGGTTVLTVSSPDLDKLPYGFYADEITKSQLRSFTNLLAMLLAQEGNAVGTAGIQNVDLRGLFDQFEYFAAPERYGFAALGKYGSCLVGVYGEGNEGANGTISECEDVQGRVYWDEYHPTTHTHSWIAHTILDALR